MFRAIVALLAVTLTAAEVRETETISKSFELSDPRGAEVVVDSFSGSVNVVGRTGNSVELVVWRTLWADSTEKAAEAKREERLDISRTGDRLVFYVDGPYRSKDGRINYQGRSHYGYESVFDFELRVPAAVKLELKTVNEGDITVRATTGDFNLRNINGSVRMEDVAGSGRAYALNGKLHAGFRRSPPGNSYFGSLNGDVEVIFPPNLSADVWLKSFNGEIFTDYAVTALAPRPPSQTTRRGARVYKIDPFVGLRIGDGGPEIEFDAFNGDVRILSQED